MESDNKINKKDINIEIDSDDMDYSFSSSESSIEEKDDSKKINEALLEKEEMSEQEKISEKILKKWVSLQKIIKEEITLEEVIITRYKEDFEKFKNSYDDYYETKLKFRDNFEEMKYLGKKELDDIPKNYLDRKGAHQILIDTYEPIKNLLFLFRENYDYIIKLVSLIDNKDNKEKVESLVELFCNQFYDNIFIPNPEQKELLLLIFLLIKEEINNMDNASLDEFLDNNNFLGKFISSFVRRQEMNIYLSMLLTPLINSIENVDKECIDISLKSIQKYIIRKQKGKFKPNNNDKNILYNYSQNLYNKIPKSNLVFKKNYELDMEKEEEENMVKIDSEDFDLFSDSALPKIILKNLGINKMTINEDKNLIIKKEEYNEEYNKELNLNKLLEIVHKTKDDNFKEYIMNKINNTYLDKDLFTNKGLINCFEEYKNDELKNLIIGKYRRNFLFIKKKIEYLLQSIFDKISTVPYTIRCICKIIYVLMSKKFKELPKYYINAFIGKFFFGKYIFPVLSLEYKNILNNRIFSNKNKKCINIIISVIEKAFKGELFQTQVDPEKTIFNHYLIELFPIINTFFEKLIDVELSKIIEKALNEAEFVENNSIIDDIFNIQKEPSEINKENQEQKEENIPYKYDYFSENQDEIIHLQSICFSLNDILFILTLINKNLKIFSNLPKYDFFCKTFNHIKSKDYKIDDQIDSEPDIKRFFILFKEEKTAQLEKLVSKKKKEESSFLIENQNLELICKRVKLSIKTVLKGLNLLNNKDFSHLIGAISNEKFFSALQYTLDDLENFSENMNQIPLKWYGLYLSNNKKRINEIYQKNDYEKLYEEMLEEETKILEELKKFSRVLITRNGMNLGCGEKILEQMNIGLYHMKQAKKLVNIEKFVNTEIIEVCIQISKENEDKNMLNPITSQQNILILDAKECPHSKPSLTNILKSNKKRHCYYIKDIIKFILSENFIDENDTNLMGELKIQIRNKIIYKILISYMKIVTEKIKNPIVNKNIFFQENNDISKKEKEKYYTEIRRRIWDYILKKIYRYVYPKNPIGFDDKFYNTTRCLDWITPELLNIKKEYINQLGFAELCLKRMEEAISVSDKLEYINNAVDTIICTVKFSGEEEINVSNEEMIRIFMYILIKAQLKRINSNINYIKCFAENEEIYDKKEELFNLLDNAVINVLKINSNYLKMNNEEFNKKFEEAKLRYNIDKI
jgi:hypothetical protein